MEKIKWVLWAIYGISLTVLLLISLWATVLGIDIPVSAFIYWLIGVGEAAFIVDYALPRSVVFKVGFALFAFGAIFAILNVLQVSEVAMRLAFINFVIALGQSLASLVKNE